MIPLCHAGRVDEYVAMGSRYQVLRVIVGKQHQHARGNADQGVCSEACRSTMIASLQTDHSPAASASVSRRSVPNISSSILFSPFDGSYSDWSLPRYLNPLPTAAHAPLQY